MWMAFLGLSLRRYWQDAMGQEMGYGHSLKLPNLLMKGVCVSSHLPKEFSDRLFGYLHVPLDSYSIIAVRNCFDGFPAKAEIGPIPANAAMGLIKSPEVYQAFQVFMRSLAKKARVPPIAIDILAWDRAH